MRRVFSFLPEHFCSDLMALARAWGRGRAETSIERKTFAVLLRAVESVRPTAPQLSKEAGEKLQDEHMANIHKDGCRAQACNCRAVPWMNPYEDRGSRRHLRVFKRSRRRRPPGVGQ